MTSFRKDVQALVDSVTYDAVGRDGKGGNGWMLSEKTFKQADKVRKRLLVNEPLPDPKDFAALQAAVEATRIYAAPYFARDTVPLNARDLAMVEESLAKHGMDFARIYASLARHAVLPMWNAVAEVG